MLRRYHDKHKKHLVIDAALGAGVNRLSDVDFYASDTTKAYEEARILAIAQATDAAETLATAAGRTLGKIIVIESYNVADAYVKTLLSRAMNTDGPTSIYMTPDSNTEASVTVRVVFELK